ncbi:MAG: L,D-transpeptidase family protein, partial [Kiritimatiellae bacterium]|nr:L,D-transpeptidase family protein [Kiritimatiellia bacterium]
PAPAAPAPDDEGDAERAAEAVAAAKTLEAQGRVWDAREALLDVLPHAPAALVPDIEKTLGRLADAIYLTPRPAPGKVEYAISPGDSLSAIASKYVCPVAFIMKANGIADPSRIRPGAHLVFADHPRFEVRVSKEANTLLLTLDGKFYKRYTVGTGRDSRTPVGTFKIRDRIEHPEWWSESGKTIPYGDPANILGTHWLSLEATGDTPRVSGYGIHGTWDESSLGSQSSAGCVRMRNADVEELWTLLPRGTPVTITEAP